MIWSPRSTIIADPIVTIAREADGTPAGIAISDQEGVLAQLLDRDTATAVALRMLELSTQLEQHPPLRRPASVTAILQEVEN